MQNSPLKCSTNNNTTNEHQHEISHSGSPDKYASPPALKTQSLEQKRGDSDLKASRTSPQSASPDKIKIKTTSNSQAEEDLRYQSPPSKNKVYVSPSKQQGNSSSTKKRHASSNPFGKPIEIIKDKLFWISDKRPPQNI